jgi:hypothetical protein
MNDIEKKKYILNEYKNNKNLYDIIKKNIIPYTENSNGIFINLSKLNKDKLYLLYINIKNNCYKNIEDRDDILFKYKKIFRNNKVKTIKVYKKFENLTDIDLQIIEYSKKI